MSNTIVTRVKSWYKKRKKSAGETEIKFDGKIFRYEIKRRDDISGKHLITSVCFNRPQYYKKSVVSLLKCRGIENYALIINQDGDDPEMNEFIEGIKKIPVVWYKNKTLLPFKRIDKKKKLTSFDVFGCPANVFISLYRAFEIHKADKVIVLEDDIVPSPDFLSYFEFCFPVAKDRRIFTISPYFHSLDDKRVEDVTVSKWFCPWGWGIRKEVWDEIKQDWGFDGKYGGWDWKINKRLIKNRWVMQPFVSRVQNTGEKGINASPEEWNKNQYVPVVSDGSRTNYRFVGIPDIESANRKEAPLVSVIIPTLNRGKYIRQCVESALSQDYPNLEVIVVDNGSTDNTPEILASFGGRIKYLEEEKRGVSAARNKGIRSARGEFIAFLDSDDYYLPGKILLSVQKLLEDPSVSLVYTDYALVDSEGRKTEIVKKVHPQPKQFLRFFFLNFGILPSTTLLRKECLEKTGCFDETLLEGAEDTDMLFKILKAGYHFGHIPKPLNAYRWHSENLSRPNRPGEKPNNFYCDRILSSAIKDFTLPELFEDFLENKNWKRKAKKEYDELTDVLYFRHFPLSARAAAKKSREIERPFFLSFFLTNTVQTLSLLYSVLETTVKMAPAVINPKPTRQNVGRYRHKLNYLFFKLKYRLFTVFFYRYGKLTYNTTK